MYCDEAFAPTNGAVLTLDWKFVELLYFFLSSSIVKGSMEVSAVPGSTWLVPLPLKKVLKIPVCPY